MVVPVQVVKRDGSIVLFNKQKITLAISKAMDATDSLDLAEAERLTEKVVHSIESSPDKTPSVEFIQDHVETVLMKNNPHLAKSYILYRHQQSELREAKRAVLQGTIDNDMDLSLSALQILENRYLLRDETGKLKETPTQLFKRVAQYIASQDDSEVEEQFFKMMTKKYFFPTSPLLMNAGVHTKQLCSAFAIPIDDNLSSIFDALKSAALVQQSGGGTGFSFSRLRPKHDVVRGVTRSCSGPVSFLKLFEISHNLIKQGGKRKGANMGIMRVDHPDIMEFINLKADGKGLSNFNLSVGVTDAFMRALKSGTNYSLINPRTGKTVGSIPARLVFNNMVTMAWSRGDPGLVFLDRMNKKHRCAHLGQLETTSACGELPLLPNESAPEGSINLVAMLDDDGIFNWGRFKSTIHLAVRFLDNAISLNVYPTKEFEKMALQTRKIGLGVMGFADLLYGMGVKYDSDDGIKWAKKIMSFMQQEAYNASEKLAFKRGVFPAWKNSKWHEEKRRMRNASLTAILPTGTMSLVADVSPGMEPNFALCYSRKALDGRSFTYVNTYLQKALDEHGLSGLVQEIATRGGIQSLTAVPKKLRDLFTTAQDIPALWHIKMQAAFQEYVDAAISKTINFDASATVKDVEEGFLAAWDLGCKGITIYRDGSMDAQIITVKQT